jgi:hypothetical protein
MMWFPTWCTRRYCQRSQGRQRAVDRTSREGASRDRKNLIADQMKTNADGRTSVEMECIASVQLPAEFVPRISACVKMLSVYSTVNCVLSRSGEVGHKLGDRAAR